MKREERKKSILIYPVGHFDSHTSKHADEVEKKSIFTITPKRLVKSNTHGMLPDILPSFDHLPPLSRSGQKKLTYPQRTEKNSKLISLQEISPKMHKN